MKSGESSENILNLFNVRNSLSGESGDPSGLGGIFLVDYEKSEDSMAHLGETLDEPH